MFSNLCLASDAVSEYQDEFQKDDRGDDMDRGYLDNNDFAMQQLDDEIDIAMNEMDGGDMNDYQETMDMMDLGGDDVG